MYMGKVGKQQLGVCCVKRKRDNYDGIVRALKRCVFVDQDYAKLFIKEAYDGDCPSCSDVEADPHYMTFLANAKSDGTSYVFEATDQNGLPLFLKYEKDMELETHGVEQDQENVGRKCKLVRSSKALETNATKNRMKDGILSKKHRIDVKIVPFKEQKMKSGNNFMDVQVKIEPKEDSDALEESEVEILENVGAEVGRGSSFNPFVPSVEHCQNLDATIMDSGYRKEVLNLLTRPYDEEEYKKLWKDIKMQLSSSSTDGRGKSLLSLHKALEEAISESEVETLENVGAEVGRGSSFNPFVPSVEHCQNMDPHYMTFLANTKRHGTSYVFKASSDQNGLPLFLKYEKDRDLETHGVEKGQENFRGKCKLGRSSNALKTNATKNMIVDKQKMKDGNFLSKKRGNEDRDLDYRKHRIDVKIVADKEQKMKSGNNFMDAEVKVEPKEDSDVLEEATSQSEVEILENVNAEVGRGSSCNPFAPSVEHCQNLDPHYMTFLANAKLHGTSYVLKACSDQNGLPLFLKYEKDRDLETHGVEKDQDNDRGKCKLGRSSKALKTNARKNRMKDGILSKKHRIDAKIVPAKEQKMTSGNNFMDAEVKIEPGKEQKMKSGNNFMDAEVKIEPKEDSDSLEEAMYGSEVEILENVGAEVGRGSSCNPFVPSVEHCYNMDATIMDSGYRKEVLNLLMRPYDEEEYKKLWKYIKMQLSSSSTNGRGKSLLSLHKAVNRKIKRTNHDKDKKLNIMRGFFFWLEHLTRQDAFQPWEDAECLQTMAGSS